VWWQGVLLGRLGSKLLHHPLVFENITWTSAYDECELVGPRLFYGSLQQRRPSRTSRRLERGRLHE